MRLFFKLVMQKSDYYIFDLLVKVYGNEYVKEKKSKIGVHGFEPRGDYALEIKFSVDGDLWENSHYVEELFHEEFEKHGATVMIEEIDRWSL